jgi:hypothetical protein
MQGGKESVGIGPSDVKTIQALICTLGPVLT